MSESTSTSVPGQLVLAGVSDVPPALTGNSVGSLLIAWVDTTRQNQVFLASNEDVPPFQPYVANPTWTSFDTPALAFADTWDELFLAWTDGTGAIILGNAGDEWQSTVTIAPSGSTSAGPALAFGNNYLFVAWRSPNNLLTVARIDQQGNMAVYATSHSIFSRPTLTWAAGRLYALAGGNLDGDGDLSMRLFVSTDAGQSFQILEAERNLCVGPPSLALVGDYFYLTWADARTGTLCFTQTRDLFQYVITWYADGCHGGGPTLVGFPDGLVVGWTLGTTGMDPRLHHIMLGYPPLAQPSVTTAGVALSGTLVDPAGQALADATVIAVDVTDLLTQFRTTSAADGRYHLVVPVATYDLIFDAEGYATEIYGGVVVQDTIQIDRQLEASAALPAQQIVGTLLHHDRAPAPNWTVGVRVSGMGENEPTPTTITRTDSAGRFALNVEQVQYCILDCISPDQSFHSVVPIPKPEKGVRVEFVLGSAINGATSRPREHFIQLPPPLVGTRRGNEFHVCRGGMQNQVYLKDGRLEPELVDQGKVRLTCDFPPVGANIWIEDHGSNSWPYRYRIVVDSGYDQLPAPMGKFTFIDEADDKYSLSARLPMYHTLWYNSDRPVIVKIQLNAAGVPKYWKDPPICGTQ